MCITFKYANIFIELLSIFHKNGKYVLRFIKSRFIKKLKTNY